MECRRVKPAGDLAERRRGSQCLVLGPGGGEDLHRRLQKGSPAQLAVGRQLLRAHRGHGLRQRLPDGPRRLLQPAQTGEQQRRPGLHIPPGLAGGSQRFLGARVIAPAQPDASQLGQRPAELQAQVRPQLVARPHRFGLGLGGRTPEPQELRPVHAAPPAEAAQGFGGPPPFHDRGPVLGPVVQRQALVGTDQFAVHDAGRDRVQLTRQDRSSRLVEQGEPLRHLALEDQAAPFGEASHGNGRPFPNRRPDRYRPAGTPPCGLVVAGEEPFVGIDNCQPGVGRAVGLTLQQPRRAAGPAAHRSHESCVHEQVQRDAQGAVGGGGPVALGQRRGMGTLPQHKGALEVAGLVRRVSFRPQG